MTNEQRTMIAESTVRGKDPQTIAETLGISVTDVNIYVAWLKDRHSGS